MKKTLPLSSASVWAKRNSDANGSSDAFVPPAKSILGRIVSSCWLIGRRLIGRWEGDVILKRQVYRGCPVVGFGSVVVEGACQRFESFVLLLTVATSVSALDKFFCFVF